jgi:release factor glutamine methyltransferase
LSHAAAEGKEGSSIGLLLRAATRRLGGEEPAGLASGSPRLDAELLLGHVLGLDRTRLAMNDRESVSPQAVERFHDLLSRRLDGEPVAYLLGRAFFLDFELRVGPGVLVPRPETEALAEWAIARLRRPGAPARPRVLDVGTGSGALAIALARALPEARVTATDISAAALALARENVAKHALAERVALSHSDLIPEGEGPFDLVVANLPYVGLDESSAVDAGVLRHEPHVALFADADGLGQIRRLLSRLPRFLAPAGELGLEIGWRQGPAALALVGAALPRQRVRCAEDLAGHPRLILAEFAART